MKKKSAMKMKKAAPAKMAKKSPTKFNKGLKAASAAGKLDKNPKFKAAVDKASVAKMKKASLLIQRGELKLGLNIYLDLERNAVDQSFRDIASILYVLNSMDTEDPKALLEKINKLESSQIWRSSALEMKAFLKLKQNKVEEARKIFEGILNLPSTPSSLATRAKNMVDYLKD